jgi:hypothetical protein
MPEGFDGQQPDGEFPGEPPEGFGGERPEMPGGQQPDSNFPGEPPEGFDGQQLGMPGGQFPGQETASGDLTADFVLGDTVSGFSGVSDLAE